MRYLWIFVLTFGSGLLGAYLGKPNIKMVTISRQEMDRCHSFNGSIVIHDGKWNCETK